MLFSILSLKYFILFFIFQALKKASQEVEADEAEFDEEVKPDDGLG